RHFGYSRSYLATPHLRAGVVSFTYGLFDALRKGLGLIPRTEPKGELIGTLEYSTKASAKLRLPRSSGLHYNVDIEGEQNVLGLHTASTRPPSIYRQVNQFPATPPAVAGIGNSLNQEFINYYGSGRVDSGSLHHIKMTLIQMSIFG